MDIGSMRHHPPHMAAKELGYKELWPKQELLA